MISLPSFRFAAAAFALVSAASTAAAKPTPRQHHAAAPDPAKHVLFRVTAKGGQTVYLLGSVHLLNAEAGKLPAAVDSAFAHAGTIAFEANIDTLKTRAPELMARGRYAAGTTLRASASPSALAHTDSVLHEYGLGLDQVNAFKPWMVNLLLGQLVMQKANFLPQYGVEAQISALAHAANKPIIGLEAIDVQLGMFDKITAADQEKMLLAAQTPEAATQQLTSIKNAWMSGNTVALDSLLNLTIASAPSVFSTLVTERNNNWMPKIEGLIKGSCDALVVVGAGHLVGKQGLVEMLKAKGYSVEQM